MITDPPYLGFGFTHENYHDQIKPFLELMLMCSYPTNRIAISQPKFRLQDFSASFGLDRLLVIPDAFEDSRGEDANFLLRNPVRMVPRKYEPWSNFCATEHPNARNVVKMAALVDVMTYPEDTILDPFCGSGSIGLAAVMLGRGYIGIELLESRAKDASRRFDQIGSARLQI